MEEVNYYAGKSADNTGYVFHIEGQSYTWDSSKYMKSQCKYARVGQKFDAEYTITKNEKGGHTLTFEWDTFTWGNDVVGPAILLKEYIINNEAAKKAQTMKTSFNKMSDDDLQSLTIRDIQKHTWKLTKAQRNALAARVLGMMQ